MSRGQSARRPPEIWRRPRYPARSLEYRSMAPQAMILRDVAALAHDGGLS
jgi:hypothetical protein